MGIVLKGLAVSRGIAIGKAVLMTSVRAHVQHYYIQPAQVEDEIKRVGAARNKVVQELEKLLAEMPADAPHELAAILDVHLMLLQDQAVDHRTPLQRRVGAVGAAGGAGASIRRHGRRLFARTQG